MENEFLETIQDQIQHNSLENAKDTAKLITANDEVQLESAFSLLGKNSLANPTSVSSILQELPHNSETLAALVRAIPSFDGNMKKDFFIFIKKVLQMLPSYFFSSYCKARHERTLPVEWSEDPKKPENEESGNLWKTSSNMENNNFTFRCNTCNSTCCLFCALVKHNNHELCYLKPEYECTEHDSEIPTNSVEVVKRRFTPYAPIPSINQISSTLPANYLVKLFLSLTKSSLLKSETLPQEPRLTAPIKDVDLAKFETSIIKSHYSFIPTDNTTVLLDHQGIINAIKQTKEATNLITKRLTSSPLKLSVVNGDHLIIADGLKLKSYDISTYVQVSSTDLPAVPFSIVLCPQDPSVIAVATLKRVLIYVIDQTGTFSLMNEIQLMLEQLGANIFINSIHWIPLSPLHIVVVCNTFIKIYDVPTDCLAPISCFTPSTSTDSITSTVIIKKGDDCIGLIALASGQIAYQSMMVDSSVSGSQTFKKLVKFPGIPLQPIISYCEESDLFFITAAGASMRVARLDDILNNKKPSLSINTGTIPSEMMFVCCLPSNPNLHIFVHPFSSSLTSIEFTDNRIEVAPLCLEYPRPPNNPFMDMSCTFLSTFITKDNLHVIEKTGTVSILKYGELDGENEIEESFTVPASFWTQASISTTISMSAPSISHDCHRLMNDSPLKLPDSSPKSIDISSSNSSTVIVGFRVFATYKHPHYVVLHGRRTILRDEMCLPLKPHEAKPLSVHKLSFFGEGDLTILKIDVFVTEAAKIRNFCFKDNAFNWKNNGETLYDFEDDNRRYGNEINQLCSLCCNAIIEDDSNIDEDDIRELVTLIYSSPEITHMARSVLIRISKESDRFTEIWAQQLIRCIENKLVQKSLWQLIWRDYELFPSHHQAEISKILWSASPPACGLSTFVCAFFG